ncbi:hypothetical protein NOVOSPHI9U_580016 [Novosphingobium sp. 9U]|nr:hypothetical protein NOVOSPHI9U_580016 [Novosphingobium sp. 9U]
MEAKKSDLSLITGVPPCLRDLGYYSHLHGQGSPAMRRLILFDRFSTTYRNAKSSLWSWPGVAPDGRVYARSRFLSVGSATAPSIRS